MSPGSSCGPVGPGNPRGPVCYMSNGTVAYRKNRGTPDFPTGAEFNVYRCFRFQALQNLVMREYIG